MLEYTLVINLHVKCTVQLIYKASLLTKFNDTNCLFSRDI